MISQYIAALVEYGLETGLVPEQDKIYTINSLLDLFRLEGYEEPAAEKPHSMCLEEILKGMLDYAYKHGLIKDSGIACRDLFDTRIMGLLVPRPSEVIARFRALYRRNPGEATDYYYKFSQDTDYIRRYRISKDIKWITETEYGNIDITINLSKPEKDPKAIAQAKLVKQRGYPRCQLCRENEGYAGRADHPARQNHRVIPVTLADEEWGFQYSPYVYYKEHCIVFNYRHTPMKIDRGTFRKLLDFVKLFPHYFVGSNADLPIVGGSILTHDHFQGGNYEFAMARAPIEHPFTVRGYEQVACGIVKWPMSVIRLRAKEREQLINLGTHILDSWRGYTDEEAFLYACTDEPHNTITPIARKSGGFYELDLVLRNNMTTAEYPYGVYHPHEELHHIKKENIGLIEVMGLAVLPARLKAEMELLKEYILAGKDIASNEAIAKHGSWAEEFLARYDNVNRDNIGLIVKKEIGLVFLKVLEHAGVFKRNPEGRQAFFRFIYSLDK